MATGFVNIWSAPAGAVAESFHRIQNAFPDRFLLGIDAGHREHTTEHRKPYDAMANYLDRLDAAGVPADRRVLAALGPRMLWLSGQRSAGAHPALVPTEHTTRARAALGPGKLVARPSGGGAFDGSRQHARSAPLRARPLPGHGQLPQ